MYCLHQHPWSTLFAPLLWAGILTRPFYGLSKNFNSKCQYSTQNKKSSKQTNLVSKSKLHSKSFYLKNSKIIQVNNKTINSINHNVKTKEKQSENDKYISKNECSNYMDSKQYAHCHNYNNSRSHVLCHIHKLFPRVGSLKNKQSSTHYITTSNHNTPTSTSLII